MFARFSKSFDRHSTLLPLQIGFTPEKSCTDAIKSLTWYNLAVLINHKFVVTIVADVKEKNSHGVYLWCKTHSS